MKIAIICSYPLPYGMAATTRIFSYSKGLVALGADVEVISYMPSGIGIDNPKRFPSHSLKIKRWWNFRKKGEVDRKSVV